MKFLWNRTQCQRMGDYEVERLLKMNSYNMIGATKAKEAVQHIRAAS